MGAWSHVRPRWHERTNQINCGTCKDHDVPRYMANVPLEQGWNTRWNTRVRQPSCSGKRGPLGNKGSDLVFRVVMYYCAPSDAILTSRLHVVTLPHLRFLRAGRSAVWGHIRSTSRALNACHVCGAQVTASEPGRLGWTRLFVELGSYFQHKDLVSLLFWHCNR